MSAERAEEKRKEEAAHSVSPRQEKFTPGPWSVVQILYPAGQDVSFEVQATRRLVSQTIMREVIREDHLIAEDEANTRLIAAAPDLLAACRQIVTTNGTPYDHDWASTTVAYDAALTLARAAIAKAEGK